MSVEASAERLKSARRNDPCPCGSGKKYKKCHLAEDEAAAHADFSQKQAAAERLAQEEAEAEGEGDAKVEPAKAKNHPGKAKQRGAPGASRATPKAKNLPRRRAV